jgi:hypothetical protein
MVWQTKSPAKITSQLVTNKNPTGNITNSDLELVASLIQHDISAQYFEVSEQTITNG